MAFQDYLQHLVDSLPDAQAAVMVAFDGEPVSEALSRIANVDGNLTEHRLDRFQIQLLGAQLRGILNILGDVHERASWGVPRVVSIRSRNRVFFIQALKDNYYLLLVMRSGAGLVGAEQKLMSCAETFNREM